MNKDQLVLALRAGARSIINNNRLTGANYVWDFRGDKGGPKEISYYDAAVLLAEYADELEGLKDDEG